MNSTLYFALSWFLFAVLGYAAGYCHCLYRNRYRTVEYWMALADELCRHLRRTLNVIRFPTSPNFFGASKLAEKVLEEAERDLESAKMRKAAHD